MKKLGMYKNGNYNVVIFDDGTKIRFNKEDSLIPSMPESMDIKITDYCDCNCSFCHENSSTSGKHADLNAKFIETLHPYTELAIGGGNPLSHPHLITFLKKCKQLKLIPNITVNQRHFIQNYDMIKQLSKGLVYGVGISVTTVDDDLIEKIQSFDNAVIHIINGVISEKELLKLYDKNLKILILGYKYFRRGETYYQLHKDVENKKMEMADRLQEMMNHFKVVSFDNLAITQLNPRRFLSDKQWEEFYMGDDGNYTMYIDMVKQEFAKSSTSRNRHKLLDDIQPMFETVRKES